MQRDYPKWESCSDALVEARRCELVERPRYLLVRVLETGQSFEELPYFVAGVPELPAVSTRSL